jgi:RNA polymerase sigma-70 factor (ECF subfamily)
VSSGEPDLTTPLPPPSSPGPHLLPPAGRAESEAAPHEESIEAAALRGEHGAIEALWRLHRRWVAAVLLAYKPRSEDLEDLLQDVAMTMLTKINTVREAGNIRAWLRTVAINIARAAGRSERARPMQRLEREQGEALIDHSPTATGSTVALGHKGPGFEANDEARRVMRLCESLPEGYREPLLLKAVHGMRTRQISKILDLPEATVDTRISRARRMLREQAGAAGVRCQVTGVREGGEESGFPLNGLKGTTGIKWQRSWETPVA